MQVPSFQLQYITMQHNTANTSIDSGVNERILLF